MLSRGVGATTRVAAVIGHPVRHSLSPAIHNAAFEALGLDWVYLAFDVPDGAAAAACDAVRHLGLEGLSVTMPHKAAVAAAVDDLTDDARVLGAVNCVVHRGGRLLGDNTDGEGFLGGLAHDAGLGVDGLRCAVLGAGGAARAVVRALALAGADVEVVARSAERAAVAAAVAPGAPGMVRVADHSVLPACGLIVNATPVGMAGAAAGQLPLDPEVLSARHVVVDLVYDPLETPLLAEARRRGASAHDGLGMLVCQAAGAFTRWTGLDAPLPVMFDAVRAHLAARQPS